MTMPFHANSLIAERGYWDLPENDPFPEEIAPSPQISGKEILEADEIWNLSDYHRAVSKYKKLVEKDPENAFYQYRLGEAYRRLGNFKKARFYLERAVEIDPSFGDAQIALGFAYLGLQENEKAFKAFESAAILNPGNVDAAYGIALVFIREGKREEAYEILTRALNRSPDYLEVIETRAKIDLYFNRFEAAYEEYKKLQEIIPSRVWDAKLYTIRGRFRPTNEFSYIASQEEEEDLITHIKTTRILTKTFGDTLSYPLRPDLTITSFFKWYQEEQQNLVVGRNNYKVNAAIFSLGMTWGWADNWQIAGQTRGKLGRNSGENGFPFQKKDLWESSLLVRFTPEKHFASAGIVQDSFIARDFTDITSFFVKINPALFAVYEYRFAHLSSIGGEYWGGWYEGQISNRKKAVSTWIRYRIPRIAPNFLLKYYGEYAYFDRVDPDYYSYRRRMEQQVALEYLKLFLGVRLSLALVGGWQRAVDFVNVADILVPGAPPPQILKKNIFHFFEFKSSVIQSIGERFEFEGNFTYYQDTNHYVGLVGGVYLRFIF